ncbi:transposon Ty3-G Gag-Pol polyprotein [Nephila pilipes]|uniref:Transposon Ty3-G Gag-Pol polyprotein n=1 Tax=Nephila pilipes TaxID=299642 RepID=A0A8X6U5V6_NEPPI|nr:transposon Ty3-G Gag-Pol polyprotein [Nephila pilipes]
MPSLKRKLFPDVGKQISSYSPTIGRRTTPRMHSAACHPQSGMMEKLDKHIKNSLRAHENLKWTEILPVVLLGLRTAIKKDLNANSSQLVYVITLRLHMMF